MQIKQTTLVLLLITIFSTAVAIHGQSAQLNSEKIRQLREEITKRENADVPGDLAELNRSRLIERRAELRTLLKIEIDNLRKHKTLLGSFATAEESQKIDDSIRNYTAEIERLGSSIQSALATEKTGQPEAGTTPPSQPQKPVVSANPAVSNNGNGTKGSGSANNAQPGSPALSSPTPSSPSLAGGAPLNLPAVQTGPADTDTTLDCDQINQGKKSASELDKIICGLVRDIPRRRAQNKLTANAIDLGSDQRFELIKVLIGKKSTPKFLVEAEDTRMDKQVGSAPSDTATTSLVVKGGAPTILGFAVENGGLTQNVDGSAITFRGNPVGLFNALANRGFVPSVKEDDNDPILRVLKRTSFAFTFNTDRGPEPGVFTASKQQLSSYSARVELINNREPKRYIKDWEDFLANSAQRLANVINISEFIDDSDPNNRTWIDPALQAWFEETQRDLAGASDAQIGGILQARLNKLPLTELRPQTITLLDTIEQNLGLYLSARDDVLDRINSGTLVTFEYLNKREVNAPDTSNFRLIAEKGTRGGKVDFTFNGSLTMFNNMDALRNFVSLNPTLPAPRRLRDFQFSGQIDVPFGRVQDFGQFVVFAGGRYERLLENATTNLGQILPNTKGDIAQLQLGLKVPIKGTGFKIPITVTFANRTELIKEKTVRGHFGFTLDLDTLFARFKPF